MADDPRPAAEPMLAIAGEGVPTGREWVHEVKWDGMRLLADVHDGAVRLLSRSGRDVTDTFPELRSLCRVADDVLLDGEVIALRDGAPSFAALADRMHVRDRGRAERLAATRPVTFMVFDVLRVAGTGVTHLPWTDRRRLLEALDLVGLHCQVPQVHDDGAALFEATRDSGLEGVVSKRRSSPYLPGRRSGDWVKSAHRLTVSAVVGGWRPESNGSGRIGALLVGQPDGAGGWRYAGRVGSGVSGAAAERLTAALEPLVREASPFSDDVPRVDAAGATWVAPELVVELRALGHADSGRLRQPTFLGVRPDLTPGRLASGRS